VAARATTVVEFSFAARTTRNAAFHPQAYACQVRFLWRFKRSFLRRLCLLIFAFRRFLIDPIILILCSLPSLTQ
jgi:hypothetical protein